jgi:hypothetical protein
MFFCPIWGASPIYLHTEHKETRQAIEGTLTFLPDEAMDQ